MKNLFVLFLTLILLSVTLASIIVIDGDQKKKKKNEVEEGEGKALQRQIKKLLQDQKALQKQAARTHPNNVEEQAFVLKTIFSQIDQNGNLNQEKVFKKLFRGNHKIREFLLKEPMINELFYSAEASKQAQILGCQSSNLSQSQKVDILDNLRYKKKFNKLLSESSQNIQHNCSNKRLLLTNWTGENWLSNVKDEAKVSQLSIPGTHDSAAYQTSIGFYYLFSYLWKTQTLNFASQLSKGIRFFDLRIKCQTNQPITLFHSVVPLGSLSKATGPIRSFLVSNPEQFVIILVQKQQGNLDPIACGNKFLTQFTSQTNNHPRYCWGCNPGVIPMVGDLRGKIWLLEANDLQLGNQMSVSTCCSNFITTDNTLYFNQNYWQGSQTAKKAAALQVLNKPKSFMRFNFLSQASATAGSPNTINEWARLYNSWYKNIMQNNGYKQVGVIIHDLPDDASLSTTINSNL